MWDMGQDITLLVSGLPVWPMPMPMPSWIPLEDCFHGKTDPMVTLWWVFENTYHSNSQYP